jgi:hypothetical protein
MSDETKVRADIATRFQKGNDIWKHAQNAGRPERWTVEETCALSANLLEWMDRDDSICLSGFIGDNYITFQTIQYLTNKFPEFLYIYNIARNKIANRLATRVGKSVHVVHYNRYQATYDDSLKSYDKEMMTAKTQLDNEEQKIAEKKAMETSGRIQEQIKEYLSRNS